VDELTTGCFKSSSDFAQVLKRDGGLAGGAFGSLDGCFRYVRTLGELECAPAEAGTGFPDLPAGLHEIVHAELRRHCGAFHDSPVCLTACHHDHPEARSYPVAGAHS
jgi:hypothetical protein